ncbi:putative lactoylglutathione lyase [Bradyrhizobium yuanmingense]
MPKMIFVNLPVTDLKRATAFYEAVGAVKNPQFSDETASCMVFSETIFAMLLTHDKFRQFTPKPIADARTSNQVLFCLSADSRSDVDDIVARAAAAGGMADPGPKDEYTLHIRPQLRGSGRPHVGRELDGSFRRPSAARPGERLSRNQ